ncbi:MAG: nucleoside phosphorylase [Halobacteriales archaeon]
MTAGEQDPDQEVQYHLKLHDGDVAPTVLLPGDPGRVDLITEGWDAAETLADNREYRTATGTAHGTPLSVTSTGIGGPSAAIAVEELARVGANTLLRVGSCGAVQPEMSLGDLVITSGAVRQEGTTQEYVREDYPAVADERVVAALVAAAEKLGHDYHVGLTLSTDAFYAGQARQGFGGYEASGTAELLNELRETNVKNIEMEAATVLTLATLYGLRAGAVCTVFAERTTGEFQTTGERTAAETATLAASILAKMDERTEAAGADRWHPGLGPV